MRNYLTFNGIDSRDYGVYISGPGVFNSPEREYNVASVPGRNGDIIVKGDRFSNIEVTYPAFIANNFKSNIRDFRSALSAVSGYAELKDSYNTNEFRQAYFAEGIEVAPTQSLSAGEFEIVFNCKPQRWFNTGKVELFPSSGSNLPNATNFDAQPLIHVVGYGDLTIGDVTMTISNAFPHIYIDSEIMDCYSGTENANGAVTFSGGDFPVLKPGENIIEYSEHITRVSIVPRWWHL